MWQAVILAESRNNVTHTKSEEKQCILGGFGVSGLTWLDDRPRAGLPCKTQKQSSRTGLYLWSTIGHTTRYLVVEWALSMGLFNFFGVAVLEYCSLMLGKYLAKTTTYQEEWCPHHCPRPWLQQLRASNLSFGCLDLSCKKTYSSKKCCSEFHP
jgi:hypothetical protein